jgi:hypothetical protein
MKNKSFFFASLTFSSGILVGMIAFALVSFRPASPMPSGNLSTDKISVGQANTYFRNYYNSTQPVSEIVKGFTLNSDVLQALNQLSVENPGLSAFRIYMGKDESSARIGLVLGVDANGKDVPTTIYKTGGSGLSPCPPICDASSQVTAK